MRENFKALVLVLARTGILSFVVSLSGYFIQFRLSFYLIFCSILTGVVLSKRLLRARLRLSGIIFILSILAAAYWLSTQLIFYFWPAGDFSAYYLAEQIALVLIVFGLSLTSSYLFWRSVAYTYAEICLLLLAIVALFSPHRSYQLDFFKFVNDAAWQYQTDALYVYCLLAFAIAASFFTYINLYNSFKTPQALDYQTGTAGLPAATVRSNWPARIINTVVFLTLLFVCLSFSNKIYHRHQANADTALQNGVGSENEEGVSPLNFDSALGTSSQPAALVRFNQDYLNNPLSPLLYLRESALSELKQDKMVLADRRYDKDLSRSRVSRKYARREPLLTELRSELSIDVYLLAQFNEAFALDYPLAIDPLVLSKENSKRFRAGYKALSLVPGYELSEIFSREVGDQKWTKSQWQHYTTAHADPRYAQSARDILRSFEVGGNESKVMKAAKIVAWLTKNATYTLTPHHDVKAKEDPTAAFLFGDLRGYCVHFAHATTFMLRSLGIPARVATGFMTDLSQAKDGHILLRMSDRHAWAEVYLQDLGWVPFDTQPENVENHADTPVDQQLLDDLIDSLTTDMDPISDQQLQDEPFLQGLNPKVSLPEKEQAIFVLCLLLALIILRKLWLYSSWRAPANLRQKHLRFYRSLRAILSDLNLQRNSGETTEHWLGRVALATSEQQAALLKNFNYIFYQDKARQADAFYQPVELAQFYKDFLKALSPLQKLQILANPQSVFYIFK